MSICVRAPGRVNLIGDHTDYTGGLVLPMAIDRWTEIRGEPSQRITLKSEDESGAVDFATQPTRPQEATPAWGRYVAAVRNELAHRQKVDGIAGTISTTLPIGAGLSSSASLMVAIAVALGFDGSAVELAQLTRRAEVSATGVPTGIMDQLCIASATPGHATRIDCNDLTIDHVAVPEDVMIAVRFIAHRTLEGSEYSTRVSECSHAEAEIGPLPFANLADIEEITDLTVRSRARHVISENERVTTFAQALASHDYRAAGEIMVESHHSLAHNFDVSTPTMNAAVDELCQIRGVYGARMTGGGFGGCVVALCEPGVDIDAWIVSPVGGVQRFDDGTDDVN
ncbi:MAG: galactokinase [Ilumatobacteraceae bacterium]|nr:galactokinase [Ilumatobacteraceae bacterium]